MASGVKLLRKAPGFLFVSAHHRDQPCVCGMAKGGQHSLLRDSP
jgi:hypothetical protein